MDLITRADGSIGTAREPCPVLSLPVTWRSGDMHRIPRIRCDSGSSETPGLATCRGSSCCALRGPDDAEPASRRIPEMVICGNMRHRTHADSARKHHLDRRPLALGDEVQRPRSFFCFGSGRSTRRAD